MAGKACRYTMVLLACAPLAGAQASVGAQIPPTATTALNGQQVSLPGDLRVPATVLIIGFTQHSQDATTAWQKLVRLQLARSGSIGFYDMAMLAEIPGFVRPVVLRSIKHAVPDVLKPNFLPLTDKEDAWKQAAGYAKDQPDAAYVLLVDRGGRVQWSTHAACSVAGFEQLRQRALALAGTGQ